MISAIVLVAGLGLCGAGGWHDKVDGPIWRPFWAGPENHFVEFFHRSLPVFIIHNRADLAGRKVATVEHSNNVNIFVEYIYSKDANIEIYCFDNFPVLERWRLYERHFQIKLVALSLCNVSPIRAVLAKGRFIIVALPRLPVNDPRLKKDRPSGCLAEVSNLEFERRDTVVTEIEVQQFDIKIGSNLSLITTSLSWRRHLKSLTLAR